jgi:hypothetical protein
LEKRFEVFDDEEGWVEITENENALPLESWIPEKGDEVCGFYLGLREFSTEDGTTFKKHLIEDRECVWTVNDNVVIANALRSVKEGTPVKIRYLGTKKGKSGWKYKNFSIVIKKLDD